MVDSTSILSIINQYVKISAIEEYNGIRMVIDIP